MSRAVCHCDSCDGRAPEWPARALDWTDVELLADYRSAERRGICHLCDAPTATCVCGAVAYLEAVGLPGTLDADERADRVSEIRRATRVAGLVALEDDPSAATWAWGLSDRLDALLRAAVERAAAE